MSVSDITHFMLGNNTDEEVHKKVVKLVVLALQYTFDKQITAKGFDPNKLREYFFKKSEWVNGFDFKNAEGVFHCIGTSSSCGQVYSEDIIRYYVEDNVLFYDKFTRFSWEIHGDAPNDIYKTQRQPVSKLMYNSPYLFPLMGKFDVLAIKDYIVYE